MATTIQIIANLQNNAASPIKALREDIEGLGAGAEKSAGGFSKLQTAGAAATGVLVAGITASAVAIGGLLVDSVRMAAEMEAQVSNIAAVWGTTAEAISPVKELIQDLGLDPNLKVTATEAALAIENLAKNGLTMDQVLQGAAYSTVLLANATGADFGVAANVATDVMALFNIKAEDMKTAVDGITSVTVASKFAIDDYAMALAQGGGVAAQLGVSFEDFNTALVATASYFKSGSDAGTSFKTFIQRLVPSTKEATDMMKSLGIITDETGNRFYDAEGNMQSMAVIAGVLNETIGGLSEEQKNMALTTMFGSDALRFAGAIAEYTTEEFLALQKVMGDTDALEQAKTRVDNFRGAWEIFTGVIDGLKLQIGSALLPALKMLVEFLTGNLVVAGSAVIDVFEKIVAAGESFISNVQSGMSVWGAMRSALYDIGTALGMTADQTIAFSSFITNLVQVVSTVVGAFTGFISQFLSWKDVLAGVAISIASFVLPVIGHLITGFLSLIAPILATIAIVALLRHAWEADFLGIRTAVEGLLETAAGFVAAFSDSFADSGDFLGSLITAFQNLVGPTTEAGQAILDIGNTVRDVIAIIGDVVAAFQTFFDNLRNGVSPINSIVQLVMSIGTAFGIPISSISALIIKFADFIDIVRAVFEPTIDRIKEAIGSLGENMAPVGEKLGQLKDAFINLVQALLPVGAAIGVVIGIIAKFLGEVLAGIISNAGTIIGGLVTVITGVVDGVTNAVQSLVDVVRAILQGDWAAAWEAAKGFVAGWVDAARTQLEGLGQIIDGILGTIFNAVVNTFNDLTGASIPSWEQFKQAAGAAFQGVVDKIKEVLGTIKDAVQPIVDFFAPTIERIKEAFLSLGDSVAPVGEKLGGLKDAFARLGEALEPVFNVLQSIASFIVGVFLGVIAKIGEVLTFVGGVIGAAVGIIAKFLGEILAGIISNAGTIIGGLVTVVTGIVEGITSSVQSVVDFVRAIFQGDWAAAWEAAKSYVSGMVESVKTVLGGMVEAIDGIMATIWDAVVNTFNDLTGATLPSWEAFKTGVVEKLTQIKDSIAAAVQGWNDAIVGKIAEISTGITSTIEGWKTGITTTLQSIATSIATTVGGWKDSFTGALDQIKEAISSKVEEWKQAILSFGDGVKSLNVGESIKTSIVDGIANIAESIRQKVAEWADSFRSFIDNVRNINIGEAIVDFIVNGLATFMTRIGSTLTGWMQAFTSWVNGINWYDVGYTIVDFIIRALVEFPREVVSTLQEWGQAFTDWASDTAGDLQDAGQEIVETVIEGLKEFPGLVADTLQEWAEAFVDWASNTAGDLQDTGTEIIDAVIEGLREFPGLVADTLQEWAQAFLDWASSTAGDLQDTGTEIIDAVIEGLREFPGLVADTLQEWAQAFLDWASSTASDLADTGREIIDAVIEGLKEFPGLVADTLKTWAQAFVDWATNTAVELQKTGTEIINAIITGLKEFPTLVAETLKTWISAFAQWVGDSINLLTLVGTAIVTHIITGLKTFWENAVTTVSEWFTNITTYIQGKIAELISLGASIVQGIISGIQSMAQAVVNAAASVVQGGIDAIRNALGNPHSPAPALIPLGSSISEGLAAGIMMSSGLVVGAISDLAAQVDTAGVKAFSEAMQSIGEAIQSAIASFIALTGFGGASTGGASQGLASIVLFMQEIVDAFVDANSHSEEVLEQVGKFADTAGAILELIVDSLLPLRLLASIDLAFLGSSALLRGLWALRDFLYLLVAAFAEAAAELGVMGVLVEAFAAAAESVVGLVESSLKAIMLLSGFNFGPAIENWHLAEQIVILRNILRTMVREFAEAALEFSWMGEAVETFTSAAESIISLVEDSLRAVVLLSGFNFATAVQGWHLAEQIVILRNILRTMVREFVEAALEFSFMGEAVEAFTSAAESVVGLVEDSLRAIMLLSGFNFGAAVQGWHLADQIVIFRNIIRTMVREFAEAAGEFGGMSDAVSAFAEAAEGVIGIVEDGLAAAVALSQIDFGAVVQGWHLADQIVIFRNIIRTMVREFAEAAGEFGSMADSVQAFAEAGGAVVELVESGLKAVEELSAVDFGALVQGWHLAGQIETFRNIIRTMMREFAEAAAEFGSLSESVQAFAEAAGAVVDLIEPGIEAIKLLANYSADTSTLAAAMQKFTADIVALTLALASGFQQAQAQIGQSLTAAAEFAENAGKLVDIVEPGIEALAAIAGYEALPGIRTAATTFAQQLVAVLVELAAAFAAAATSAGAVVVQAADFSESAASILDIVEPGIDALVALATYSPVAGISASAAAFGQQLVTALVIIASALSSAADSAVAAISQAATFAESAAEIIDVIVPGIEALAAIAEYEALTGVQAAATVFAQHLVAILLELATAFAAAATSAGTVVAQAATFSESAEAILDIVEPGIDALVALATYSPVAGISASAAAFGQQLVTALVIIASALSSAADSAVAAISQAATFAESAAEIIDVIVPGIEALVALTTYVPIANAQAAVTSFAADLVTIITLLVQAMQESGILANAAVVEAGEMASSMSDLVDVVAPAVEAVVFLVGYTQVANLRTFTQQFAADLAIVITTLVDGLRQAGLLANAAVAEAGEMAKHLEDLLKVVDPALDGEKGAIPNLLNYTSQGGLKEKTAQFVQDLITVVQTLVDGLTQSALATGIALQKAGEMAKNIEDLFKAVSEALDTMKALAEYEGAKDLAAKVQKFTADLVMTATMLVNGLTNAANQLGAPAIAAAGDFAKAVTEIATQMHMAVSEMETMAGSQMPPITPVLNYIIKSAGEIAAAAQVSGSIGNAAAYMAQFADTVQAVVAEVFEALQHLAQLATANTPGSIQAIIDTMVNALRNAVPSFGGAGEALAAAVEAGFRSGDYEGAGQDAASAFIEGIESQQGEAVQTVISLISAMLNSADAAARLFTEVGKNMTASMVSGVQATASTVTAAVVKTLTDAINAARGVTNEATGVGQDLGQAAAAGMNSMKSALDASGASAGAALIEGLRRSIANGQSSVVNQIIATVRAAINAAENALGISSPSKVFYRIGRYLSDGLRLGVEAGMAPVIRAVDRFARNVSDTMSAGLSVSVPSVQLSGSLLTAPVTMSSVTPKYRTPQPVISQQPAMGRVTPMMPSDESVTYNDIQVNVSFPNGTTATPADIKKTVQTAVEDALLKSGRRVDASRRLK